MCVYPNWYRSCTKNAVGKAGGGSRSHFVRSGSSIALPELTRNSPPDCFPGVNSLLRTLYALVAELEYASDLSSVICEFKSHRGTMADSSKWLGSETLNLQMSGSSPTSVNKQGPIE